MSIQNTIVSCVRCRGESSTLSCFGILEMRETRNSCFLFVESKDESCHLEFWSLETLTASEIGHGDWLHKENVLAPQIRLTKDRLHYLIF